MSKHAPAIVLPNPTAGSLVRAESAHTTFALLEFQSPTAALINESVPFSARMTLWLISTMVLLCFVSMAIIKVDMDVTTSAVTVSRDADVTIQPLQTAILRKVLVKVGQQVKKGQLLAQLDPTFASSDATSTVAQMKSLQAQVDRLRAEMGNRQYVSDGTPYSEAEAQMWQERHANYEAQVASLKATVDADRAKVLQLRADEAGFRERLPLAQTIEDKRRQLASQGLDSQLDLLQAEDYTAQLKALLADDLQQISGAEQDLSGAVQNLVAFVHQWFSQTSDTLDTQERALSDMVDQATKNKLVAQLVDLTAPQDAVVDSISQIAVGSVLQSGDQMLTLVPINSPVEVVVQIQGNDAGFVRIGDYVTLKFSTLPYATFGFAVGTVRTISANSFSNLSPTQPIPAANQPTLGYTQPNSLLASSPVVYTARVSIDQLKLNNVPPGFKIVPGMPIEADIKVGRRSVVQFFFERIFPYFDGLHEPT
jgi:HlyD family secretion protein